MLKKYLIIAGLILSGYFNLIAQSGLEGIFVEKYYESTARDTVGSESGGYLPIGSVTYRIYADLQPVYRLQAVYGVAEHELRMATTTRFYNCASFDGRTANDIQPANFKVNTLLLDSWVSVGAAAIDYQGIVKATDDSMDSYILKNFTQGLLMNSTDETGDALTKKDGMKYLRYQPAAQLYNLDNDLRIFEYQYKDSVRGLFSTRDGAWASYGGSVGPQPDNKVLIAQLTTDGVLSFELNLQLAVPNGGTEKFVAKNPGEGEVMLSSLTYSSSPANQAPLVELVAPDVKKLSTVKEVRFSANASDRDGKIAGIDFYVNDRYVSSDIEAPYTFDFSYSGKKVKISATAIDNLGLKSRSNDLILEGTDKATGSF